MGKRYTAALQIEIHSHGTQFKQCANFLEHCDQDIMLYAYALELVKRRCSSMYLHARDSAGMGRDADVRSVEKEEQATECIFSSPTSFLANIPRDINDPEMIEIFRDPLNATRI